MSTVEDFTIGSRVVHTEYGEGDVIVMQENSVTVSYDKLESPGIRYVARYERDWFTANPDTLTLKT